MAKCWCKSDLLDLTEPQTIAHLYFASNGPTEIARRLNRTTSEISRELCPKTVEGPNQPSTAEHQWVAWSCNASATVRTLSSTAALGFEASQCSRSENDFFCSVSPHGRFSRAFFFSNALSRIT